MFEVMFVVDADGYGMPDALSLPSRVTRTMRMVTRIFMWEGDGKLDLAEMDVYHVAVM